VAARRGGPAGVSLRCVELIGREAETARLHELIAAVGKGGAALVLRGDPGIGKSALLAEAAAFARASGLHQLLWPVRDSFGVLPANQREALRAALGLTETAGPEVYLVALAVLNLLAEVAETAPVLLLAEDAHWLDASTGEMFAFLARRLESEPIVLLAAVRHGFASRLDGAGLPGLVIPPLAGRAAAALLEATAGDLPAVVRARLLTEAAGNPLALIDLTVAMPAAEEAARLASETGQPFLLGIALATQAKIAALRGGYEQARELAAEAERLGTPAGARPVLATAQHARALAALGQGDYPQALTSLLRLHDPADPSHQLALMCHTVADLADAASRGERKDEVASVLAGLEAAARATTSPSLHDGLRLARALLAGPQDAEALFRAALAADLTRRPFIRARTQLGYGEWLRRQRRAADSRPHLRAARDTFDALGTAPWSERARRELRAAGERSGERQAAASDILTAQELQIAQLAADGLTNREIGKRLYVSHRTAGAHLAKIYAKLGVTSRVQLHRALRDGRLPAGADALVIRDDPAHVAGVVPVAQPALDVLLVQPGEGVPVQFDAEAGRGGHLE
jgi:DNA-binding CsgD family transcriptional regulator